MEAGGECGPPGTFKNRTGYGGAVRCAGPTHCNQSWMMSNHERQAVTDMLILQTPVAPGVK